jgi:hypothetical protein
MTHDGGFRWLVDAATALFAEYDHGTDITDQMDKLRAALAACNVEAVEKLVEAAFGLPSQHDKDCGHYNGADCDCDAKDFYAALAASNVDTVERLVKAQRGMIQKTWLSKWLQIWREFLPANAIRQLENEMENPGANTCGPPPRLACNPAREYGENRRARVAAVVSGIGECSGSTAGGAG